MGAPLCGCRRPQAVRARARLHCGGAHSLGESAARAPGWGRRRRPTAGAGKRRALRFNGRKELVALAGGAGAGHAASDALRNRVRGLRRQATVCTRAKEYCESRTAVCHLESGATPTWGAESQLIARRCRAPLKSRSLHKRKEFTRYITETKPKSAAEKLPGSTGVAWLAAGQRVGPRLAERACCGMAQAPLSAHMPRRCRRSRRGAACQAHFYATQSGALTRAARGEGPGGQPLVKVRVLVVAAALVDARSHAPRRLLLLRAARGDGVREL